MEWFQVLLYPDRPLARRAGIPAECKCLPPSRRFQNIRKLAFARRLVTVQRVQRRSESIIVKRKCGTPLRQNSWRLRRAFCFDAASVVAISRMEPPGLASRYPAKLPRHRWSRACRFRLGDLLPYLCARRCRQRFRRYRTRILWRRC